MDSGSLKEMLYIGGARSGRSRVRTAVSIRDWGGMQLDDAATILGRADFFEVCDAEQRRLLAFASERKKYRPDAVIYARRATCPKARMC